MDNWYLSLLYWSAGVSCPLGHEFIQHTNWNWKLVTRETQSLFIVQNTKGFLEVTRNLWDLTSKVRFLEEKIIKFQSSNLDGSGLPKLMDTFETCGPNWWPLNWYIILHSVAFMEGLSLYHESKVYTLWKDKQKTAQQIPDSK